MSPPRALDAAARSFAASWIPPNHDSFLRSFKANPAKVVKEFRTVFRSSPSGVTDPRVQRVGMNLRHFLYVAHNKETPRSLGNAVWSALMDVSELYCEMIAGATPNNEWMFHLPLEPLACIGGMALNHGSESGSYDDIKLLLERIPAVLTAIWELRGVFFNPNETSRDQFYHKTRASTLPGLLSMCRSMYDLTNRTDEMLRSKLPHLAFVC
ncbi:hypothetical protein OF83DRAFT_247822 [Amylostereum chailletii]|nr:hypothetical protein OF83DRAFT_247822 [Amylostereum chailletii]